VRAHDDYFTTRPDAIGKFGFTSYQKCFLHLFACLHGDSGFWHCLS
jgi:hypothetical protein